jgi:penicillin amidase
MRLLLRLLGILAVLVVVLVASVWFGGRRYLGRSVAQYEGSVAVPGTSAPVEVLFDARGVPQVYAKTDADARFALGWLHASERLFQMELTRRMARGELSALFGPIALDLDEQQRRIGFAAQNARDIATIDPGVRATIEQYLAGVNAWIVQARPLPPEFVILGFKPRDWTVEDVSLVGFYQSWFALTLMDRGADYREAFAKLGGDASRLANAVQAWSPATVPAAEKAPVPLAKAAPRMTKASNSWVIAPRHSVSAAALHASDPHLELSSAPGLWYAVGLHSDEGLEAVGVSAPGLPSISMGHNGVVSWAFTVAPVDLVDDYKEIIEGADTPAPRVRTADGWAQVEVRAETIAVKDAPARVVRMLRTPRGPVLSMKGDTALVMHWAGYDFPAWTVAAGADALMRMHDFDSFRRTVANTGALSVNWTYADKQGNIGYQLGSPIPVRDGYDTFTPQWGTDVRAAWRGYRTLDERPFALNPAQGWLATTNDQVVGERSAYAVPGFYHLTRKTRIAAILDSLTRGNSVTGGDATGKTDPAAMTRAQRDLVSGNAVRWRALAATAAEQAGNADAAKSLREWDGRLSPKDVPATLWSYWWLRLPRELFEDELGDDWARATTLTVAALSDSAGAFVDDVRTPERESLEVIATRAMRSALAEDWDRPFGAVQTLTVKHPLASVAVLDRWLRLTRGPVPIGGDDATLDAAFARFDTTTRTLHDEAGPSMRFVLDWSDVDGFTLSRHLGQSGNPLSPHFSDFLVPHLAGEPWPMPFTRAEVAKRAVSTLTLVPAR